MIMQWRSIIFFFVIVTFVSSSNDDHTCENPDTCFEKAPSDAKYVSEGVYFPSNSYLKVRVLAIKEETHNSKLITFGLPPDNSLGIVISSAILMNVPKKEEDGKTKSIPRPYNPIRMKEGSFNLLVKIYPEGLAGAYVSDLKVGDMVGFKQTKGNIKKFRFPFKGVEKLTMVAGGTGIAPMYQALVPILEENSKVKQIRLLYSNKTPQDIMLKKELDALMEKHPNRFVVHYVIGEEKDDGRHSSMYKETGWIDEDKIRRLGFPPSDMNSSIVWICGVDKMYESLAGSRMKSLTEGSALHNLGFTTEMVWRS